MSFYDYGCGYGGDVARLKSMGLDAWGYDPYHQPYTPLGTADVVNLGHVINVIEDPAERDIVVIQAYNLCLSSLLVASPVASPRGDIPYGDGRMTTILTFNRGYDTAIELREYLEIIIGVTADCIGSGVYRFNRDRTWFLTPHTLPVHTRAFYLDRLNLELSALRQDFIAPDNATVQQYGTVTHGRLYLYYRMRSPDRNLPGKSGAVSCLHLGEEGSDRYLWAKGALIRRERYRILRLRYKALQAEIPSDHNPLKLGADLPLT